MAESSRPWGICSVPGRGGQAVEANVLAAGSTRVCVLGSERARPALVKLFP
jgi:hypothetical protein